MFEQRDHIFPRVFFCGVFCVSLTTSVVWRKTSLNASIAFDKKIQIEGEVAPQNLKEMGSNPASYHASIISWIDAWKSGNSISIKKQQMADLNKQNIDSEMSTAAKN